MTQAVTTFASPNKNQLTFHDTYLELCAPLRYRNLRVCFISSCIAHCNKHCRAPDSSHRSFTPAAAGSLAMTKHDCQSKQSEERMNGSIANLKLAVSPTKRSSPLNGSRHARASVFLRVHRLRRILSAINRPIIASPLQTATLKAVMMITHDRHHRPSNPVPKMNWLLL
jgi:hypothetical protein